jgi:hypothetical protein
MTAPGGRPKVEIASSSGEIADGEQRFPTCQQGRLRTRREEDREGEQVDEGLHAAQEQRAAEETTAKRPSWDWQAERGQRIDVGLTSYTSSTSAMTSPATEVEHLCEHGRDQERQPGHVIFATSDEFR